MRFEREGDEPSYASCMRWILCFVLFFVTCVYGGDVYISSGEVDWKAGELRAVDEEMVMSLRGYIFVRYHG